MLLVRVVLADGSLRARRATQAGLAAVVLVALVLRGFDYDVMPEYRENADETFAMWNGWSLLHEGQPRGWTPWRHIYEGRGTGHVDDVWAFGVDYRVATPYFDHPPLMHVVAGVANHLAGTREYLACRLRDGRLAAISLSILTLLLTFVLARRIMRRGPAAWIAVGMYATLPFLVLQNRVVKEECLLVVLELLALECFFRWRDDRAGVRWLDAAAVAVGLAPMTKVPGAALIVALLALVIATGDRRAAVRCALISVPLGGMLFVYGAIIDWEVFIAALREQSSRAIHFNIFLRWFDDALVNHNLFGRGWLIFLWLATMAAFFGTKSKEARAISVVFVCYWLAISVGTGNWTYGWYAAPWYPFLCIGAGLFLAEQWRRPTLLGAALFTGTFVFYSLNFVVDPQWAREPSAWPQLRRAVTVLVVLLIAPAGLVELRRVEATTFLARGALFVGVAIHLAIAAYFIARYEVLYDTYRNFDRMVFFDR